MNIIRTLSTALAGASLLVMTQQAAAFGATGHRIVAQIAEQNLTPTAAEEIAKITDGEYLAQLATWPDEIRSDPTWNGAAPWHYLSIDDDESFDDFPRDDDGDVWFALEQFEQQLRDRQAINNNNFRPITLKQALAFYVHFTGDIHQPLHVGRRDDLGGNKINVRWFGKDSNLHKVWDEGLIDHEMLSFREYADFLDQATDEEMAEWQDSTYLDWAKESKAIRPQVYGAPDYDFGNMKPGVLPDLSYTYVFNNHPLIGERMLQGGVRLAGMLNAIFDPQSTKPGNAHKHHGQKSHVGMYR